MIQKRSKTAPKPFNHSGFPAQFSFSKTDFHQMGFDAGYEEGKSLGLARFGSYFEGTSIMIAAANQYSELIRTMESIMINTTLPYEIIVVDRGSTDQTHEYLETHCTQLRYRIVAAEDNECRAINYGMMMAKGTTLLWLPCGMLVKKKWLEKMFNRMGHDPSAGVVKRGPIMLCHREVWAGVGYLDERYKSSYEAEQDYLLRMKLQGYSVIELDGDLEYEERLAFEEPDLGDKWGSIKEETGTWRRVADAFSQTSPLGKVTRGGGEHLFFPQYAVVQGPGRRNYWIESGRRHPIVGKVSLPVVRLSQINIQGWPLADHVEAKEVEHGWKSGSFLTHAVICTSQDQCYLIEEGKRRRFISAEAAKAWKVKERPWEYLTNEALNSIPEGRPVIAPVQIAEAL